MITVIYPASDIDEYDLDDSQDVDLINDLEVASGSNASGSGSGLENQQFQILILVVLGMILGVLLVGSRRFT